jgi:hypothetical protein
MHLRRLVECIYKVIIDHWNYIFDIFLSFLKTFSYLIQNFGFYLKLYSWIFVLLIFSKAILKIFDDLEQLILLKLNCVSSINNFFILLINLMNILCQIDNFQMLIRYLFLNFLQFWNLILIQMVNPLIKILFHSNSKSILITIKLLLLFEIFDQLLNLLFIKTSKKQWLIYRVNEAVREPFPYTIEHLTNFLLIVSIASKIVSAI